MAWRVQKIVFTLDIRWREALREVALIDLLFDKNEALNEATPTQFYGLTAVLNVLAIGVALMVPRSFRFRAS